jgi:hypothetical protein
VVEAPGVGGQDGAALELRLRHEQAVEAIAVVRGQVSHTARRPALGAMPGSDIGAFVQKRTRTAATA